MTNAVQFTTGATFNLIGLPIANASVNLNVGGGSLGNNLPPTFSDTSVNATYSALTRTESGSVSGPQTITLATGLAYTVDMRLQANCTASSSGGAIGQVGCTTSATIDPIFAINPGQANAGLYSFSFSPGVGNGTTSTAPEPASFLLFGAGLFGVGLVRRAPLNKTAKSPV